MNNENLFLKFKNEIINELKEYYKSLLIEVDKKKQDIQNEQTNIKQESNILNDQINKILESNLNDINNYFVKFNQISMTNDDENQLKEDIKKEALKSYLICVIHNESKTYFEFKYYIDQNEQIFIEFENYFLIYLIN